MKISLGPILYYWEREAIFKFYDEIAATSVDIVYLGETVCSRRHNLRLNDWLSVAEKLAAAGKEVVLSTQALLESESDMKALRKITENNQYSVEANDMGAVHLLNGRLPFVIGPHINVYNAPSLSLLSEMGAKRWVMPVEMSRDMLNRIHQENPFPMETEVFAFGRLPLAFSARCFTARHHNLPKDDCQFRCMDYANGLTLKTREGQPFLVLNGIQTQSASVYNLVNELAVMDEMGVKVVRISPQAWHTTKIIEQFRQFLNAPGITHESMQQLAKWMPDKSCDGYWHGRPGLEQSTEFTPR